MTKTVRLHGASPYTIAAVHGGPGGIGEARPFAEELSKNYGVIEPFLITKTLDEQLAELKVSIETYAQLPVTLIGHSYGAMLCYVFAGTYPDLVSKLIMISSGVLDPKDVGKIDSTRFSRLSSAQKQEVKMARISYKQAKGEAKKRTFIKVFGLIQQIDAYEPIPHASDLVEIRPTLYDSVWEGMQKLRDSGELVAQGKKVKCPVVVIHGDYDPRPAESIRSSLSTRVDKLDFILLEDCGHYPWYEKKARDIFYKELLRCLA